MSWPTPLQELYDLACAAADGQDVDYEVWMECLQSARESLLELEGRASAFAESFPGEPELADASSHAIGQLKQALGAIFLYVTGDETVRVLPAASQLLAQGGATTVACLRTMKTLASEPTEQSVLTTLYHAVETEDADRVAEALLSLTKEQQVSLEEVRALEHQFAPHSWRETHLLPLLDTLEEMERKREELVDLFERRSLGPERVEGLQILARRYSQLKVRALTQAPTLQSVPPAGRLRELLSLIGEVYEERTPLSALKSELQELTEALQDHYQATICKGELQELFRFLHQTVQHNNVKYFPVVWDKLLGTLNPGE
jgi:hypothetical protein